MQCYSYRREYANTHHESLIREEGQGDKRDGREMENGVREREGFVREIEPEGCHGVEPSNLVIKVGVVK